VAQLDKAGAACAKADAARPDEEFCHAAPRFSFPTPTSPTYLFMCRDCTKTCGRSGGEGRDASSALGSGEAGDNGTDRASRATIARAYEVGRGDCGGEIGAGEGGEGGSGC
jgi:hypothetical protein